MPVDILCHLPQEVSVSMTTYNSMVMEGTQNAPNFSSYVVVIYCKIFTLLLGCLTTDEATPTLVS